MEYVKQIIQDLLTMLYQYLGISIICSVLFLLVWKQADETSWSSIWNKLKALLHDHRWKKRFLLILYVIFVLQRTIFNRGPWGNPLENVLGNWWFLNDDIFNCEVAENILMFIPLYPIVKICENENSIAHIKYGRWDIIMLPFICSLSIEMIQLLFRVGSFQLSDIFYNTIGGILGGLFMHIWHKLKRIKGN